MTESFLELAKQKQTSASGGHNNYWLQDLPGGILVEAEDVIENLDMHFSDGTVFKSIWRLCKERQGLGKPGSTPVYEAGKGVYYSERTEEISKRWKRNVGWFGTLVGSIRNIPHVWSEYRLRYTFDRNFDDQIITIKDPKRLEPYSFRVKDLMIALGGTRAECNLMTSIMALAYMRQRSIIRLKPHPRELDMAEVSIINSHWVQHEAQTSKKETV